MAEGARSPVGRPYESWYFTNPRGQTVHGFYVTPPGEGPFPVLMHPHGGPTWLDEDRWSAEVQSYVDEGFVVGLVNYRGSTGYGAAWRDALFGDIGGPELEDLNAGLDDLVARGIADPTRAAVGGWSWGGYLTLMELGKHPERWRAGVAGVPVGDYELSYDDMSPDPAGLRPRPAGRRPGRGPRADGGSQPHQLRGPRPGSRALRDRRGRQPMPAAARRWPTWTASRRRDHPHEVYRFATGHGSFDTDEDVRQQVVDPRLPAPDGAGARTVSRAMPTWLVIHHRDPIGYAIWRVGIASIRLVLAAARRAAGRPRRSRTSTTSTSSSCAASAARSSRCRAWGSCRSRVTAARRCRWCAALAQPTDPPGYPPVG